MNAFIEANHGTLTLAGLALIVVAFALGATGLTLITRRGLLTHWAYRASLWTMLAYFAFNAGIAPDNLFAFLYAIATGFEGYLIAFHRGWVRRCEQQAHAATLRADLDAALDQPARRDGSARSFADAMQVIGERSRARL